MCASRDDICNDNIFMFNVNCVIECILMGCSTVQKANLLDSH